MQTEVLQRRNTDNANNHHHNGGHDSKRNRRLKLAVYPEEAVEYFVFPALAAITPVLDDALYLSGCAPVTLENQRSRGITAVVRAMTDSEERQTDVRSPADVHTLRVQLLDAESSDIGAHFDSVAAFIDEQLRRPNGRVLVHCVAGISRSVSLLLAYLMRYRRLSLRDAFALVKSRRSIVRPNNAFFDKLIDYERSIFGRTTVRMVTVDGGCRRCPDILLERSAYEDSRKCVL